MVELDCCVVASAVLVGELNGDQMVSTGPSVLCEVSFGGERAASICMQRYVHLHIYQHSGRHLLS